MQNRNREDSSLMSKERSRIEKSKGSRRAVRRRLVKESINIFLNGLLFRNPVAVGALGLFPVVGAGFSLANAAALSLMMFHCAFARERLCAYPCYAGRLHGFAGLHRGLFAGDSFGGAGS